MVWTTADLGDRVLCYPKWPDGLSNDSIYDKIYNVLFLLFTYIVPIGSMTYTYVRIGIELWGSQSIGECTQRQMENIKNKRRVSQPDPYLICHSTQLCRSLLSPGGRDFTFFFYNPFLRYRNNIWPSVGCQDDDGSSYHLRCVLAAIRLVLHRGFLLANNHELPIRPRNLLGHILVSDEQLNVQSNNILLDERKVSPLEMYIPCYTDQSKIIKFDLIFRPGTVRTQLYNACQTPSTTDTYYTNVHDHEMGAYNSSRGSRKSWKNTEMRQLS
ncbi:g-protein coupled receptor [Holotrichia oblita]|uniref:G-protein coupled receptor n=1 Tax=Holotrichia oblita TaxID=644536 RepID=A0ACB9SQQ5_HOLOL|nr:g-protein coupled receptor [Holotrichia oblita]